MVELAGNVHWYTGTLVTLLDWMPLSVLGATLSGLIVNVEVVSFSQ